MIGNELFYCLWSSRTKYPGRMAISFESFFGRAPKLARELIYYAGENVNFTDRIEIDQSWVKAMTDKLTTAIGDIPSISMLKNLNVMGVSPGAALANEITTLTKNKDLDLNKNHFLIKNLIESYLEIYNAVIKFTTTNKIQQIFLYNGRFLHERAVWDAAKSLGLSVTLFETTRNRYFLRQEGFHSRIHNQRIMLEHWNNSSLSLEERIEIGSKYFSELKSRSRLFSSDSKQKFNSIKPYFVYYSSSDDETVGFWEEWNEPLGDQIVCVKKLQDIFDSQNAFELVIRIHPNLKNKSKSQINLWRQIRQTRSSRIIEPNSPISSYDLLTNSMGTITFGSTIGLESAFALKPSLVIAECGYDMLGVVDKAISWEQVLNWIQRNHKITDEEMITRKNNACIRGFFIATGGIAFKYTTLVDIGLGAWNAVTFDGMKMKVNKYAILCRKLISRFKFRRIMELIND